MVSTLQRPMRISDAVERAVVTDEEFQHAPPITLESEKYGRFSAFRARSHSNNSSGSLRGFSSQKSADVSNLRAPGAGGDCLLYLERTRSVPSQCKRPAVLAWAILPAGQILGDVAKWCANPGNRSPAWNVARSLGFR